MANIHAFSGVNIGVILSDKRITNEHLGQAIREMYENSHWVPQQVEEMIHRASVISAREPKNEDSRGTDHRSRFHLGAWRETHNVSAEVLETNPQ